MVVVGMDFGISYEPSLMSWGAKTNEVMIQVVVAAFMSGFILMFVSIIRGCHDRRLGA